MKRDFLTFTDFTAGEIRSAIARALELKALVKSGHCPKPLAGCVMCLIFEKSSTRTRVSFEVGMHHLGGYGIYMNQDMSQLGRGETYADTAKVLSRYVHVLVMRTFAHENVTEMAKNATVPVINGLSDSFHPCQVMADLVTLTERGLDLNTMRVSYIGDGNNMAHSWMEAAKMLGFELRVATPKGYAVDPVLKKSLAGRNIRFYSDPKAAAKGCDVLNTDTWFSMGQKVSARKRKVFAPFQINGKLLKSAGKKATVMHCLPAHRGEEITDEVLDGPQSVVFDQAENRLFAQMAVLEKLLTRA